MKSKEELEKEPMPYDNETPKKCPKCGNWFLNYPALSRRDNKTYICPDCGVKEAMEDYMSSRKKEGLEEATAKALLEDPENESLTKPLTESVDWSYYNKFEDLINKYMPDEGEGETLASQIVTAVNKLIYKWYNDGDVFDNVNSGLNGWANDLSDYANWLYKYAPGDTPHILKRIYDITNEDDYEVLLRELADNLLDENLLNSLEKNKQGSIYDCDGPFEFSIYDEDEDEEDSYEDEEDLDESKKLNEGVNNLTIKTGLTDRNAYDVLSSVVGQLADGIWENSPGMSRYWQHMDIDQEGSEVVAKFDTQDYDSGFRGKDESQIKKWLANKVKQIVKEEGLDWDRNNTERVSYMHGNVTVQDAYRVYDKLLGRKDYIPDPNKKEESKEIDDIESEYRQAIDRAFDIMKLYGKDNKYYRKAVKKEKDLQKQLHDLKALKNESKEVKNVLGIEDGSDEEAKMTEIEGRNFKDEFNALSKEEQDKYKELIPVNQAGLSGDKSRALAKQYNLDAEILYWIANIGKFDLNESKEVMKKEINKDELLNKLEDYVLNQYTIFNDKLYDDFGDIQLNDKDNTKRSIYIYYDIEEDKISVTVGAAGARTFVDTLDEVAQFINAEIAKVNAQDEELKESKEVKTEGTKQKRIARYNEFDNGYVFHSWKEMTDEEAEEKAKQASIEDPTDVYYVAYDDIMNPSSEIRWYKGKSYSCDEITELRRKEKEALLNKTESKEDLDKEHDEYLKKMDKKYKTFCKNLEITDDPDDALSALDELEGQFGDEDGEYQELREFIYNELLESKEVKTENDESDISDEEFAASTAGFFKRGDSYVITVPNTEENINKIKEYGLKYSISADAEAGPYADDPEYLDVWGDLSKLVKLYKEVEIKNDLYRESKEVKTESSDINLEKNEKVAGIYYQGTDINSLENSSKCNKYKIGEIIGNVVPSRVHGDYTVKSGPYKIIGYGSKQKDGKGEGFYIVIGLKGYVTVEKGKLYAKQDNLTSISELRENGEAINYNYSFSMVESKKAISKKNFTDEEIRKAIRADIKEHNGLFTDDSKYDVIERLTGIADIDEQPEGLWERVDKIYETEFDK